MRDGLVGVKRMEKAFQRQVIYGGSLDTILLEMNLVPEDRLTQYLALASGLPPAARDEGDHVDRAAVALLDRDLAHDFRAVPVTLEGEAVRVLVCSPLVLAGLEDLADLLDRPIQPLITPEYRWHLVYAAAYEVDAPARFTTLARALDVDAAVPPVGRAPTIIVDERAPVAAISDLTEKSGAPMMMPVAAAPDQGTPIGHAPVLRLAPVGPTDKTLPVRPRIEPIEDETSRGRTSTIMGFVPVRAATQPPVAPAPHPQADAGIPTVTFRSPTPSTGVPHQVRDSSSRQPSVPIVGVQPPARARTAPITTGGRDAPLTVVSARELLASAEDRDTVFLTLLRAVRSRARWAGLLTVQGGAAIGRVALAEDGLDTHAIQTVLLPLDAVSPFRTVVSNHQPHIGALVSGDPGIDAMLLRMGGALPPSALLMPIVLRDRVVALVVAHRVHSDIRLADITELLPIATAASDAIARLIVKHKAAGYRAATEPPVVEIEAELVDTKKISRGDGGWQAPGERPSVPGFEQGTELSIEAELPRPIEELLAVIEASAEGGANDEISECLDRGKETVRILMQRFPGKLRVERFAVSGRPLRAAQYGGLLELVIQLGSVSAELLIEKMGAPQRDVRFYAIVCCAELRPRSAVYALAERLFDQDYGVRACAIEALAAYPLQDLGHALVRARRAIHSGDPEIVGAATNAIVELGDIEAIADLIGVIERADRAGEHARKALVSLTAQDFGPNERKWRRWYDGARHRHRIEWLIEGLGHKEDAVRENAINILRRLTGEYFGYHYDLPRRERDAAAERWVAWWRDAGQRRFVTHREDERHRPTAELPIRRDPA